MPRPDAHANGEAAAIPRTGLRLVLLDIEGTTCPVSFVSTTLFPYASRALEGFLKREAPRHAHVQQLLEAVEDAWQLDPDPAAVVLRQTCPNDRAGYLRQLIGRDSKLPALKELQGLVWRDGYASGELVAPLFTDVPPALRRWRQAGLELGVYSSGSVAAQQLLYRFSDAGDLSGLFSYWFDTGIGPKQEPGSYQAIANRVGIETSAIVFISDALVECRAAHAAGMTTLFSHRDGNPERDPGAFPAVGDFAGLILSP